MNYWLIKTEPNHYSWDDFVNNGGDKWDGVRNYQARNNLKEMALGDIAIFYHSGKNSEMVGLVEVTKEHYPDPTTDAIKWVAVNFKPLKALNKTVTLSQIKEIPEFKNMLLVRNSRLSVMPILEQDFNKIIQLANEI